MNAKNIPKQPSINALLKPYRGLIAALIFVGLFANGLGLILPLLISRSIDAYTSGAFLLGKTVLEFALIGILVLLFTSIQAVIQTYASERVARDLRTELSAKISRLSYASVQAANPSKVLTNLTSDIDSVKLYVSQVVVSLVSSTTIIVGAAVLLLSLDWLLALVVLLAVPILMTMFMYVFSQVRKLFMSSREVFDRLNRIINESILGAALIRVLYSRSNEAEKFSKANAESRDIGMKILSLFAAMIPMITLVASLATLAILLLGGHFVMTGRMTLGELAAFNSYLAMLIFPILIIGFMSNVIAQASASYGRVRMVLDLSDDAPSGGEVGPLQGAVEVKDISVSYGQKDALKHVSFSVKPGDRVAIIGPTGAGKTQLIYALAGLRAPDTGSVLYDGKPIESYAQDALRGQVGVVFQDSSVFHLTLRENIAFSGDTSKEGFEKAIKAAELGDFIGSLSDGLDTIVSERGSTLSGGQKQRLMLARALSLNPKVLLLDDFTARVDSLTEKKILENIAREYPGITLISVTQKIGSVEDYDHIVLLMEGEVLAEGAHKELMKRSPEYVQIYASQQSTNTYELHA